MGSEEWQLRPSARKPHWMCELCSNESLRDVGRDGERRSNCSGMESEEWQLRTFNLGLQWMCEICSSKSLRHAGSNMDLKGQFSVIDPNHTLCSVKTIKKNL